MKRFRNGKRKGAITIFLTIILIPTMLFSAILIDGSRLASAKAITQEAADLAAISAIADYNQELKDEYGLFAINDPDNLQALYQTSLEETLMAKGFNSNAEYSEYLFEYLLPEISGSGSYVNADFSNLFDFQMEIPEVEAIHSLAEENVLETQMVDYAKFRGLLVVADRISLIDSIDDLKGLFAEQAKATGAMKEKMSIDRENASADKAVSQLNDAVERFNSALIDLNTDKKNYYDSLEAYMRNYEIENTDTEDELDEEEEKRLSNYSSNRSGLINTYKTLVKEAKEISKLAKKVKTESEAAKNRLNRFANEYGGATNTTTTNETANATVSGKSAVVQMADDAKDTQEDYQVYIDAVSVFTEEDLAKLPTDQETMKNLIGNDKKIETALEKGVDKVKEVRDELEEELEAEKEAAKENSTSSSGKISLKKEEAEEEEKEVKITEFYFYYIDSEKYSTDLHTVLSGDYKSAVEKLCKPFEELDNSGWSNLKTTTVRKEEDREIDTSANSIGLSEDFLTGQTDSADGNDADDAPPKGEIDKEIYLALPSKAKSTGSSNAEDGNAETLDIYDKNSEDPVDLQKVEGLLEQENSTFSFTKLPGIIRDDLLDLSYIFGTFKTRLTGVPKLTGSGMSQKAKESDFMPAWRKENPDGELDMRFEPKKDRETVLRSEIEYILFGLRTDTANEAAAYAAIYPTRIPTNLIALYTNKEVNSICHAAAASASLATAGWVPEPVFFWAFLTVWSLAESEKDMEMLIDGGYKIPFLKGSGELLLDTTPFATPGMKVEDLVNNYKIEPEKNDVGVECPIKVTYEDYLLLYLLILGVSDVIPGVDDLRVMRTADLIEVNMQKNVSSDFKMSNAFTYMKADTEMSIRYMFGNIMPFKSTYEEAGLTDRMRFQNTIYLGY